MEQNARLALTLADRGYVLETGRIVLSDTSDRLLANSDVQRSYLGRALRQQVGDEHPGFGLPPR